VICDGAGAGGRLELRPSVESSDLDDLVGRGFNCIFEINRCLVQHGIRIIKIKKPEDLLWFRIRNLANPKFRVIKSRL
jgi:hypothetical protein